LDWVNPHAFVFLNTKDETGVEKNFKVEMGRPTRLHAVAGKRDTVKIGDKVTIQAAALAKDGSNAAGSSNHLHDPGRWTETSDEINGRRA
jgi:hypothetical protein